MVLARQVPEPEWIPAGLFDAYNPKSETKPIQYGKQDNNNKITEPNRTNSRLRQNNNNNKIGFLFEMSERGRQNLMFIIFDILIFII